ncbi:MAG: hypothetical protein EOP87_13155 [Verrucomicrobiaceae bacterium]|nr:MAG: hypothetical protein EOP87_13155 [Verrucomicrobiaceae bacterium]
MKFPGTFRQPGFLDLLSDAAFQWRLSQAAETYEENRHARASIIASAFSLESCANCLIDDLEVSSSLASELERLPTFAKYEIVAELLGKSNIFDRGRHEVQIASDLIQVRNGFVHPKVASIKAEIGEIEEQEEHFAWPIEFLPDLRSGTGLPRVALFWSSTNAATAFRGATRFFRLLLVDWFQFDTDKIRSLFFPRVQAEIGDSTVVMETYFKEFEDEFQSVADGGMDLSFLGINSSEKANRKP